MIGLYYLIITFNKKNCLQVSGHSHSSRRDLKSCGYSLFCGKGNAEQFLLSFFPLWTNKGHPSSYRSIIFSAILKSISLWKMNNFFHSGTITNLVILAVKPDWNLWGGSYSFHLSHISLQIC